MYRDLHDIWDYNLDCKQREQRDISFVLFTRFIQETLVIQSFKHQEVRIINKNVKRAKVSWHVSRTSANNLGASQNDTDNCIQQNNRVNEGWSQNGLIPEERWRKRKIHSPMHFHIGSLVEGAKNWPTWLPLKGNISKSNIVSSGAARAFFDFDKFSYLYFVLYFTRIFKSSSFGHLLISHSFNPIHPKKVISSIWNEVPSLFALSVFHPHFFVHFENVSLLQKKKRSKVSLACSARSRFFPCSRNTSVSNAGLGKAY